MQPAAVPPKEDGIRWLALAASISAISVVGIAIGLGTPLLSVILENRGHSATMIGANAAVGGVAAIVAAPFAIPLASRLGVVGAMLLMFVVGALSFVGFYVFEDFWIWFPLRATLHIAMTTIFILSEFWISSSAPPARRGLVLGVYATCLSLGFAIGPFIFAMIGSQGFLPFGIACAFVAVAAIPVLMAAGQSPSVRRESDDAPPSGFFRYIFMVPTATAAVLVFGAVETGGFTLFPVYGARVGYSEADAALLLSMIGLGNVLLQIPIGMLSDRMKDRRILLLACAVIGAAGSFLLPAIIEDSWWATAVLFFIWGGVVAGLYTVGLAHLGAQLSGRDLASANAAFVLCYGLGTLAGPQLIGAGMDVFGPSGFAWALAAFFVFYIVVVSSRLAGRRRRT
jgi:MFS family permease